MMYLFGELTAIETLCHSIIISEMEECIISIPSPFDADSIIDLYVTLDQNTKNDVKFVNGSPYITSKIYLNAKILSSEKNSNYFEENNLKLIQEYASSYMKSQFENYLYKTSKDYGTDIDMFGRHAVKYFTTWDEWIQYNWLQNYQNAFFDINLNFDVISSYLIS